MKYINWLLENKAIAQSERKDQALQPTQKPAVSETIGNKELTFDMPDTTTYPDTLSQLEALRNSSDDDSIIEGLEKLIAVVQGGGYENPITEEKLPAKEKDIWPEIFWGRSRVALFMPGTEKQYKILKKYNWYCYIIDKNIDAELVVSHILKERE